VNAGTPPGGSVRSASFASGGQEEPERHAQMVEKRRKDRFPRSVLNLKGTI